MGKKSIDKIYSETLVKCTTALFVDATPDSKLLKNFNSTVNETELKLNFVKQIGTSLVDTLGEANHFTGNGCKGVCLEMSGKVSSRNETLDMTFDDSIGK